MAKSKEKKNKLAAEEEEEERETPAAVEKKMKVEIISSEVKIKVIDDNNNNNTEKKTSPVIGYFPSGYDPLNQSSSVKVYKSLKSRNPKNPRMELVVGINDSDLNFVGTNYSGEATTPQLCNYALGVFDKDTGLLKMVPVAANRIFRLVPNFGASIVNESLDEVTKEEKDYKLNNLASMYSTKKDIRRIAKRESLRQTEDPGTQKDFDRKLKGIKINTDALEVVDSTTNAQNIPPYNLEATTPEMAYPLDKIILKGEWDYLLDILELAQGGFKVKPDDYPSFVRNRVGKIREAKDESKKKRMAGILSYITHLVKFKDKHSMEGVISVKHHKFPSILSQKFSFMFGTMNEKRIPDEKQKLLINYILVLSLIADDFRSDPSDIAMDLRMNPVTLRDYYGYIGCKFVRENSVMLATLPIPLKFETIKRKRRR